MSSDLDGIYSVAIAIHNGINSEYDLKFIGNDNGLLKMQVINPLEDIFPLILLDPKEEDILTKRGTNKKYYIREADPVNKFIWLDERK
jgi:hypothetical protein